MPKQFADTIFSLVDGYRRTLATVRTRLSLRSQYYEFTISKRDRYIAQLKNEIAGHQRRQEAARQAVQRLKESGAAYDEVISAFIDDTTLREAEQDQTLKDKLSNIGAFLQVLHEELLRAHQINGGTTNGDHLNVSEILPFKQI